MQSCIIDRFEAVFIPGISFYQGVAVNIGFLRYLRNDFPILPPGSPVQNLLHNIFAVLQFQWISIDLSPELKSVITGATGGMISGRFISRGSE